MKQQVSQVVMLQVCQAGGEAAGVPGGEAAGVPGEAKCTLWCLPKAGRIFRVITLMGS